MLWLHAACGQSRKGNDPCGGNADMYGGCDVSSVGGYNDSDNDVYDNGGDNDGNSCLLDIKRIMILIISTPSSTMMVVIVVVAVVMMTELMVIMMITVILPCTKLMTSRPIIIILS